MREKFAQNTTNNLTIMMSTSASIIPTDILQVRSTTSASPVPLSSTMPFSSPDRPSHLTTTITIGTVDTATNVQASPSSPQTLNTFDQNQPHQSTIDERQRHFISFEFWKVIYHVTIIPS